MTTEIISVMNALDNIQFIVILFSSYLVHQFSCSVLFMLLIPLVAYLSFLDSHQEYYLTQI